MSVILPGAEPAHDLMRERQKPLDVFFAPSTVAVIGATEASGRVGRTILHNLLRGPFSGTVYPVNPKRAKVLGVTAYPSIADVPQDVDLAVIVTPAPTVPGVVRQCVDAGVKGAIIISAGFREIGAAGAELEEQIRNELRRGSMRVIGPNCLGVMSPHNGLNATFAGAMVHSGNVAFISQSGALLTAILDWSLRENIGFSSFISIGSMLDVGWGDLIDYLGDDPHTRSIVLYMESIGETRPFLSAAREVALQKPIIVIKAGRTQAAAQAAASHTGTLTGSDEVLDAAFRRCGVLRVQSIAELFYMAGVLARQPRPKGSRLTIVTNAGGPGVLATDALIGEGGELAPLSPEIQEELDRVLPPHWSHGNPVDILGDAEPERYEQAVEILARDPQSDGLLVVLTPQAMTNPSGTAERVAAHARFDGKPVLASWMGGTEVAEGGRILNQAGIPTFPYPDTAARMFNAMWKYSSNLRDLYETPVLPADGDYKGPNRSLVDSLVQNARQAGREVLTEFESKQLLAAYQIPTVETWLASSEDEAAAMAAEIGYPVVLKLHSETITHKTDVGGVRLNLQTEDDVRHAYRAIQESVSERAAPEHFLGVTVQPMVGLQGYELIIGSSIDPQFGPVLLFGTGGQLVEVFQDRSLGLPPLNSTLARRMMQRTRIYTALKGIRGRAPVDIGALEQLLVRFGQLVVEQPWIREIDINPLLASPDRLLALDARVIIHGPEVTEDRLPQLAIRPYPIHYVSQWQMEDGTPVRIRPIRPEDEPYLVKFHQTLSEQSVYFRYFHPYKLSQRIAHERLSRICFIDYDREMVLVAEHKNLETGESDVIAVGRLSKVLGTNEAELAVVVSDRFQYAGLGTELVRRLTQIGRDEHLDRIMAYIHPENHAMHKICKRLGFQFRYEPISEDIVRAEYRL